MPERRRFRVYLAGPISRCNETQTRRWREAVKRKYEATMEFLDPVENLVGPEASAYEVVEADLRLIEQADGLLVNMWRESIGATMGVVHACRHGRPVVVADPNHFESRMLAFFADAVEETPLQGAKALLNLLRAESGWRVVKSEGREDPFERRKILEAVRAACRHAKRDDVAIPGRVLPVVVERLRASDRRIRKSVTTTDIDKAVTKALDELESDAAQTESVAGVLNAWRSRHDRKRSRGGRIDRVRDRPPSDRVLASRVPISSGKSHATIWGKAVKSLDGIPLPAREIFRRISSVPGITEIKLGPFGHKGSRSTCQAWVGESPEPHVIEGKLYDRGVKGTMQSFQVRVQSDSDKPKVAAAIERELRNSSKWAQK